VDQNIAVSSLRSDKAETTYNIISTADL